MKKFNSCLDHFFVKKYKLPNVKCDCVSLDYIGKCIENSYKSNDIGNLI